MKKQLVSSYTTTHRFLSMFLVMLFLSISILQLAHVHKASDTEKENISSYSVSAPMELRCWLNLRTYC